MRRVWGGGIRTGRAWIVRTGLGLAVLSLLGGCAAGLAPPGPAPRPRPRPGYERRVDELASVDASALAGRRIAIDPGHGGVFRGAVGVNGLTEAEVNLGVALFLRGLLEARGAQVFLTRSDDRDFLSPADSSLRSDLAERTRLANAFHPDLFLSIHHNADAGGAHDVNAIQTYYKLGDEGPSLDAAQQVHRYLVRNLGIEAQRVLPGNYFVLRNCESPAILTESSYITNPDVESKLALAAKQRLEAEALFLGLARTFARRAPRIAAFAATPCSATWPDRSSRRGSRERSIEPSSLWTAATSGARGPGPSSSGIPDSSHPGPTRRCCASGSRARERRPSGGCASCWRGVPPGSRSTSRAPGTAWTRASRPWGSASSTPSGCRFPTRRRSGSTSSSPAACSPATRWSRRRAAWRGPTCVSGPAGYARQRVQEGAARNRGAWCVRQSREARARLAARPRSSTSPAPAAPATRSCGADSRSSCRKASRSPGPRARSSPTGASRGSTATASPSSGATPKEGCSSPRFPATGRGETTPCRRRGWPRSDRGRSSAAGS
ncbi:MAG: hypothetical protein E6K73_05970 [Candidatus Eisenbacteria bacterium]|uniref:MurNAc-LAA domain-containing protein n=1 Tax=Eiseniibacteriota bacterium TaxID=2212470 RepID=A0A538SJ35_UNCEI|nr:MAG: hypothetical protein E6K73_05970 [Candidatus Eisenbacteria bacterium]